MDIVRSRSGAPATVPRGADRGGIRATPFATLPVSSPRLSMYSSRTVAQTTVTTHTHTGQHKGGMPNLSTAAQACSLRKTRPQLISSSVPPLWMMALFGFTLASRYLNSTSSLTACRCQWHAVFCG
jgi:hypothetical protein